MKENAREVALTAGKSDISAPGVSAYFVEVHAEGFLGVVGWRMYITGGGAAIKASFIALALRRITYHGRRLSDFQFLISKYRKGQNCTEVHR